MSHNILKKNDVSAFKSLSDIIMKYEREQFYHKGYFEYKLMSADVRSLKFKKKIKRNEKIDLHDIRRLFLGETEKKGGRLQKYMRMEKGFHISTSYDPKHKTANPKKAKKLEQLIVDADILYNFNSDVAHPNAAGTSLMFGESESLLPGKFKVKDISYIHYFSSLTTYMHILAYLKLGLRKKWVEPIDDHFIRLSKNAPEILSYLP